MELELGSGDMGQYFTPYSVQSMMARLLIPGVAEIIREKGCFTLSAPTCGAEGMVIAYAECLLDAGFNPSEHMFVQCIDIDPIAADMAFIQLSLLGIAAEVTTGNTLTLQCSRVRYTPVYYLNEWGSAPETAPTGGRDERFSGQPGSMNNRAGDTLPFSGPVNPQRLTAQGRAALTRCPIPPRKFLSRLHSRSFRE